MTNIAVVGNSHTTAFMMAWQSELEAQYPDIKVEFFRAHKNYLSGMSITEDKVFCDLRPFEDRPAENLGPFGEGGKKPEIDLAAFDVVISVAWWQVQMDLITSLLARFNIDGITTETDPKKLRMSASAFDAILNSHVNEALPEENWRNWTTPPVLHVVQPRRNEQVLKRSKFNHIDSAVQVAAMDRLTGLFAKRLADVGIQNIPQPAHTIGEHGLTDEKFGREYPYDKKASKGKPDLAHMNVAYGLAYWNDILAALNLK